jgi:DNA/RNA-binding protein KIN17
MAIEREHQCDENEEELEEEGEGDIQLDEREEKISLNLSKRSSLQDRGNFFAEDEENTSSRKRAKTLPFGDEDLEAALAPSLPSHPVSSSSTSSAPKSALQLLMEEEEQRKLLSMKKMDHHRPQSQPSSSSAAISDDNNARYPHWLHRHIVVKIMNKRLGNGRYYKVKGVVEEVTGEGYVGIIRVLPQTDHDGTGERIKVDQEELETVIPQV